MSSQRSGQLSRVIPPIELTLPELVAKTGVTHPNVPPHEDITFVAVAWNEEARMGSLLRLAQRWFSHCVIGVQESTDRTYQIAEALMRDTDRLIAEPHHGHGDASMQVLIRETLTPWVFVVALDEKPNKILLESIGSAAALGDLDRIDAYWIKFIHITEGIRAKDSQSGHLRLFRRELGWSTQMHSRPHGERERFWPWGHITHRRSLDEMMQDYLRYYGMDDDPGRLAHNRLMMHDACVVIAERYGWDKVTAYDWWPEVRALAFSSEEIP